MFERESLRIGIIGAGRLAASLGAALVATGYRLEAVSSRSTESAARLAADLGGAVEALSPQAVVDRCDLVFVAVPDSAVATAVSVLKWRREQAVVHCSGALPLAVLAPAASAGAACGCFHPLQSFPARTGDATRFRGITCGIEADGALSGALETLATDLGARVVRLEAVDRAAYHAAAVFASNYVVALMAAAREAWVRAGLPADSARPALAPLLMGAAENVAHHELSEALTGPVARGDVDTVRRHLEALGDSELSALYRALGVQLLGLDLPLDASTARALRAALEAVRAGRPASLGD